MTKIRHLIRLLAWVGTGTLLPGAHATATDQSHASILTAAEAFIRADAQRFPLDIEITPGTLDSRLQLPQCTEALQGFEPPNGIKAGRTVVGVRCQGERPWKLYVPMRIALPGAVVVTTAPLRRGDTLNAEHLSLVERDLAGLHRDYFVTTEELVGQRLKRNLGRGEVITPAAVEANQLVKKGAEVTILAANPQIQVRVRGKALADGTQGERIAVRNLGSERIVNATVVGRGLVRVLP